MLLKKYTFQQLRDAIEIELQKTEDVKLAAAIAIKRLNKDPEYYESMQKARVTKYKSKRPDGKGGWIYEYEEKKINPFKKLLNHFLLRKEAVVQKYKEDKIKETFGVDQVTYASHVVEYLSNKDKWDKIFSSKKEKKAGKKVSKKPGAPGVKKDKRPSSTKAINKELMRSIYNSFKDHPGKDIFKVDTTLEIPAKKKTAIDNLPAGKKEVVLSDNFKNWFGDWVNDPENASKVVDNNDIPEEQKPITVFHGTARGGFTAFDKKYQEGGLYGDGFYFTEEEEIAKEYSKSKGTDLASSIAAAEKFSANDEEIEYINESKGKKELKELKEIGRNPNWDPAIIHAMDASYEKGKGFNVDKLLREYETFQELAGRDKRTSDMGKEKIFRIIKSTFPKKANVKPIVPDPEVFDVYLNIKNPLDLDSDMSIAESFLDNLEKENRKEALERAKQNIKKFRERLKWSKENNDPLDEINSGFWKKLKNGEYEDMSMQDMENMTDKELMDFQKENNWDLKDAPMTHFKHLADTIPDDIINAWAKERGYTSEYTDDKGKIVTYIGDGDIPGTRENIYEIANLIAKHGLSTYDRATDTHGVKYIPNTPEGKPTLQHLAHILSDGWGFRGGEKMNEWARSLGHDGLRHTGGWSFTGGDNPKHTVWIAFEPNQIKSATKNKGTFDPKSNDMNKAKDVSKLTKKVITDKRGHRKTVYVKTGLDDKPKEKESWINTFANLFGFKDRREVMQKVEKDYKENEIGSKHGATWDDWKNHISEYISNKEKWDNFFSGKKQKKDKKQGKKTGPTGKKKGGIKKRSGLQMSVMREIYKLYGGLEKKEDNFETMPETEEKDETPKQKAEDKKVAKKINDATPENRSKTEREIVGIPDPPEEIETPVAEFKPKKTEFTIPGMQANDGFGLGFKTTMDDYTGAIPKDIYLVSKKDILTKEKPSYVPDVEQGFLTESKYLLPIVKLENNKYAVQTHKKRRIFRQGEMQDIGEDKYILVNREILAAMHDYYLKKARAEYDKEYNKRVEEYKARGGTRRIRKSRISIMPENRMSYPAMDMFDSFNMDNPVKGYTRAQKWEKYREIRSDMKQKIEDMEIQIEEYYNTHAKGKETAYGDKGTKDDLFKDYGVKVKRQNGSEINDEEIQEIQNAMDDIFEVFGNRSSMSKKFGLKISHAGDVLMHARKAAGIFIPRMRAIGVTAKYGEKGTGFILAHEFGHFMDYYAGQKSDRHYVSDDPDSTAGLIADRFRRNMAKTQKSAYQNRTCECFARAMEQYWAIKTDSREVVAQWDTGNHPTEKVFMEKIYPLCEQFLKENNELLKAIFGGKLLRIRKI